MPFYTHASRPPFLCADNRFDTVTCAPFGSITASSAATGYPVDAVADGRRDRTWWQGADDGAGLTPAYRHTLTADAGAGRTAGINVVVLDRGHNLWGRTVAHRSSPDGSTWTTTFTAALPSLNADGTYPVGGDPLAGWCVTEEGLCYALIDVSTDRYHQATIAGAAAFVPVVTGLQMGAGVQLSQYMTQADDRARSRTQTTATSVPGWRAFERTYAWRRFALKLGAILAPEYDAAIDAYVTLAFDDNQPSFVAIDAGRYPERAGVFVVDATAYDAPITRTAREITLPYVEHLASLVRPTPTLTPSALGGGSPPPPPAGPTVYVQDDFTRADSTTSVGTPLVGTAPVPFGGGIWGISGNQAYQVSWGGGADHNGLYYEVGHSDYTATVKIAVVGSRWRLRVRGTDGLNFYDLDCAPTSTSLYKYAAGVFSFPIADSGVGWSNGETVTVICAGNTITVKKGATTLLTLTDTFNATATKFGLGMYQGSTTERTDDLLITS